MKRAEREREMLAAARAAFARDGFAATSMDRIAAAAGITKPMLYAYFDSKDGLAAACTRQAAAEMRDAIRGAIDPDQPAENRLWRGLIAVFDFVEQNRDAWDLVQTASGSSEVAAAAHEGNLRTAELLADLFTDAARAGGVGADAAAQSAPLAYAVTMATAGAVGWWLRHPEEPKELQAIRLMNLVWRGLGSVLEGDLWLPDE